MNTARHHTVRLSETVVLIDAAFLNFVITDVKRHFEHRLNRTLRDIDFPALCVYLALDAGLSEGEKEVQFLLVYDKHSARLRHCHPSDLKTELNGVAFQSAYGEFSFVGVPSEEVVSREELYLDLLSLVSDSADVKKIVVVSFDEEYGEKVTTALNEVKNKAIVQLRMSEPESALNYGWEMLAFSVMQALGIRADEL